MSHRRGKVSKRCRSCSHSSGLGLWPRHAGERDVVTLLSPRDEALRANEGGRAPQHHLRAGYTPPDEPIPPGPGEGVRFYNHMPAVEIRSALGLGTWNRYLTVCLERNPYERVVSLYFHRHRTEPRTPIEEFIASGEFRDAVNWPLYTDRSGTVMVDLIIRHEHLQAGLDSLCARVNLAPLMLPRAKSQFRPPGTGYRDLLTPTARKAVEEAYAPEFEYYGYSW